MRVHLIHLCKIKKIHIKEFSLNWTHWADSVTELPCPSVEISAPAGGYTLEKAQGVGIVGIVGMVGIVGINK